MSMAAASVMPADTSPAVAAAIAVSIMGMILFLDAHRERLMPLTPLKRRSRGEAGRIKPHPAGCLLVAAVARTGDAVLVEGHPNRTVDRPAPRYRLAAIMWGLDEKTLSVHEEVLVK